MPALSELELSVSQALTAKKIIDAIEQCRPEHPISFSLSKRLKDSKSALVQRLFREGAYWQSKLVELAQQEGARRESRAEIHRTQAAKHKRDSRRAADTHQEQAQPVGKSTPSDSEFFKPVSEPDKLSRFKAFYDATATDALRKLVCAVCARRLNIRAAGVTTIPLNQVPNAHRLRPPTAHAAHTLIEGYLLEKAGCTEGENGWMVNICKECHRELNKKNVSTPPKLSLANGLWVGEVPRQLSCLTIAEQLLIARVYPRVFVMKLFPKSTAHHGLDDDQLQGALRGNVTSFELNSDAIADMIEGNLMPQKPAVLASVLSVTFIGRGSLPNPAALWLFRVRRDKVAEALTWLRDNNPKYYGDIEIDDSRLALLPDDGGVPREILVNMHQETDDSVLNAEADSYVPDHEGEELGLADSGQAFPPNAEHDGEESVGDVVPLQYLGVMDNDMTKTSTRDIMASGLLNLQGHGDEGAYAVRHGGLVNTFGQPPAGAPPPDPNRHNYWEKAFPLLYPYGVGGIEHDRPVPLSFIEHVRWSLQYFDRRFRLHHTFMFVAYGIYQRRQVLSSARIQMRRRDFGSIAQTLSTITPQDLQAAAEEEERGRPPSNQSITVLKRYINATSSRVMGSDAARYQLRSQIWSTSVALNPPTLWMTINPDDLHDPIAQIFAGEEIDMDNFAQVAGPDKNQRSRNIARDPFAAAKFFNFLVTTILEELLGIRTTRDRVYSKGGVLGKIKAYFGVVECQGRGTLHLHMLAWLEGAPAPDRLRELLRTEDFKSRVVAYIRANVRAFHPQLATDAHLRLIPPDPEVGYSRFPDPSTPESSFHQALDDLETKVVRTKQMHSCTFGKCLKLTKHGQYKCKRHAPFELSGTDAVDEDGTYHVKRTLGYLNNYCPAITVTAKCNNDIKLLLHGAGTNNITFYVTGYIAKKQGKSYNVSGLLAKHLVRHFESDDYVENLQERQQVLLLRAVNVLNREQEVPAPLAVSLLMGWGDVYRSHRYAPVYWSSFVGEIHNTYPNLKHARQTPEALPGETELGGEEGTSTSQRENRDSNESDSEAVVLNFDRHGRLHFRSQVEDYVHRGAHLENYNVYDFLVGTYNQKGQPRSQPSTQVHQGSNGGQDQGNDEGGGESVEESEGESDSEDKREGSNAPKARRPGRPLHKRVAYQSPHPCHESHVRVMRQQNHNTLPNFIGPRLPRRSDPDQVDFYSASVLTMLKPWRKLTDLKQADQSWAGALEDFLASSNRRIQDIVASLEHYHNCKAASDAEKNVQIVNEDGDGDGDGDENGMTHEDVDMEPPEESGQPQVVTSAQITPAMIAQVRIEAANERNPGYGQEAVEIGRVKGVFTAPCTPIKTTATRGTHVDTERLANWQKILQLALQETGSAGMTSDTRRCWGRFADGRGPFYWSGCR
ncbi:hypothetical protein FS749_014256 [Ceratobasidium sp. UAMH 11750]|nr:hypothetical protein FS749_014256 [Ceratobasidium sp. UAMH 11750]